MNVDTETLNRAMASNPEEYDEQAAELLLIIKLYAKDLLDASDIIEKQNAMLREMHRTLKVFSTGACFCECGIDNPMMAGKHTKLCIDTKALLEKSKEFAE